MVFSPAMVPRTSGLPSLSMASAIGCAPATTVRTTMRLPVKSAGEELREDGREGRASFL
jgi:hypothetical protein